MAHVRKCLVHVARRVLAFVILLVPCSIPTFFYRILRRNESVFQRLGNFVSLDKSRN